MLRETVSVSRPSHLLLGCGEPCTDPGETTVSDHGGLHFLPGTEAGDLEGAVMWHGDIHGVLLRLEGTEGSERRGDFSKKADDRGRKDQGALPSGRQQGDIKAEVVGTGEELGAEGLEGGRGRLW